MKERGNANMTEDKKSTFTKLLNKLRHVIKEYVVKSAKIHAEQHRLHDEYHRKTNRYSRYDRDFQKYRMQSTISRIFIVLFNILLWYFIFHYFDVKIFALVFAVPIGISGIIQYSFHIRLERRIFKPISQLKDGVDEITKGNYDVNINTDIANEISQLIDSFNEMAIKLNEGEKLKKSYEENRKTLIANISHDLKTPITSIQGYIETMLEGKDLSEDTINKYHQIIYNNASYINKLIDDLFLFSKLDLQKLNLQIEFISIRAYMGDLMEEFKFELEDREFKFGFTDDLVQDYSLSIDRKRMHQVFRNIIGNAVKYGFEEKIEIKIRMYQQNNFVCVEIADNGPGIPADKLPHIFDRFYRVDYARTKDLMSTGLGLAIAKELTEAQDGTIKASSTESVGSCFTIMLPINKNLNGE
jgi:signal transduction histidine kinase